MDESTIERLASLKQEDLEFYQRMIAFFRLLGITEGDLACVVEMARNWRKAVDVVNAVARDQKETNKAINEMKGDIMSIRSGEGKERFVEEMNYGRVI